MRLFLLSHDPDNGIYHLSAKERKYLFQIFADFDIIPAETGQVLNNDAVDLFVFHVLHHFLKLRAVK